MVNSLVKSNGKIVNGQQIYTFQKIFQPIQIVQKIVQNQYKIVAGQIV